MPTETRKRTSLSYNFDLFMQQVKIFPKTSLTIIILFSVLMVPTGLHEGMAMIDILAWIVANAVGMAMLKAMMLFSGYRAFYGIEFTGSYFKISLLLNFCIVFWMIINFYAVMPYAIDEPAGWAPIILAVLWLIVFPPFLSGYFHMQDRIFKHRRGYRFFRRQIGLEE